MSTFVEAEEGSFIPSSVSLSECTIEVKYLFSLIDLKLF